MFDKGQWWEFGQDYTPTLTRSAMGFLMTTDSQDLGLPFNLMLLHTSFNTPILIYGVN